MTTIPSTKAEFFKDCVKFMSVMGNKAHTQEQVAGAYKCVTLRYLGLKDVNKEELEVCAMHFRTVTAGAIARGWEL